MNTSQQSWKAPLIGKAMFFVGALAVSVFALTSCGAGEAKTSTTDIQTAAAKTDNKIPGLKPVDVYLNMENQGFETIKKFATEYGNSWDCKNSMAGIDYTVSVFSDDVNSVERVKATAMLNGEEAKEIVATKPFLKYVSSIPYDGSNPQKIGEWIDQNFNNDKQSLTISNVTFTIYAPTEMARMLTIEKAN